MTCLLFYSHAALVTRLAAINHMSFITGDVVGRDCHRVYSVLYYLLVIGVLARLAESLTRCHYRSVLTLSGVRRMISSETSTISQRLFVQRWFGYLYINLLRSGGVRYNMIDS